MVGCRSKSSDERALRLRPVQALEAKQLQKEAAQRLNVMIDELRNSANADLSAKNLGDEGTAYISEGLAFNDRRACMDLIWMHTFLACKPSLPARRAACYLACCVLRQSCGALVLEARSAWTLPFGMRPVSLLGGVWRWLFSQACKP